MRILILLLSVVNLSAYAQSAYQQAWQSLNKNSKTEAKQLLEKAMEDPLTAEDAYITSLYLSTYDGKETGISDFAKRFYQKSSNPYPYLHALWFNGAVMGDYGKKSPHQVQLANLLISDTKAPGSIVASANYQLGLHQVSSNQFDKASKYYSAIGNIRNWQYTGPFENLSESGFDKDYGPLKHPEPTAVFRSLTNAEVKWFTPPAENPDGWTPTSYSINKTTAVAYAQNFVNSAADQTVYCNIGFTGNIKVWINDELVISESQERITDFDAYTARCNLKKGTNRVLVQLGYTDTNYPNFSLRFTDEAFHVVPGITGSSSYAAYPQVKDSKAVYTLLPHFSEKFFESKIAADSGNLVNYLLLTDAYLRSKKLMEARSIVNKVLKLAPENPLVHFSNILVLIKEGNRTLLLEEVEKVRQADPECLFILDYQIKELYDNEKYTDVEEKIQRRIELYGDDESMMGFRIGMFSKEKKYDEMLKLSEKMYAKYPENVNILYMMYNIRKEVNKDNKGALNVYDSYFRDNYNHQVWSQYEEILTGLGKKDKVVDMKETVARNFPFSSESFNDLASHYYGIQQYGKAEEYIRKALALSSYNESHWATLGNILDEQNKKDKALEAYENSLKYDPNQYDIITKIRKLSGKSELHKMFPTVDANEIIKADKAEKAKNTDYGYYYLLDQKDVIVYPGGANEQYVNMIIKITNQKGVDKYKESSIGYNSTQNLLIEKAEIIKKNGSKIEGEKYDNEIVFTNLEPGDVVYLKYRLQSFVYGRFAKEFTDKYYFGGQIYSAITRYNLIAPEDQKINYYFNNNSLKPSISNVENFKKYTWEILDPVPDKDEPLMPELVDIAHVLHISTIPAWNEISGWYADIINNRSEEDHYLKEVFSQIFPSGHANLTQFQKAKKIYDYIGKNIRYSSVSFRQSAYIPQKASLTLTTRLGDCKDLSNLFVTLSNMAGIKSQMVLVDTRDNGAKDIVLPGMDFNHCIVKTSLDNSNYYLELTDSELPFASLPNNLMGALILEIPSKNGMKGSELSFLKPEARTKDIIRRTISIQPVGLDQKVEVKVLKTGNLTSGVRSTYKDLDEEKKMKEMEETVANWYKNTVKLQKLSFDGLAHPEDSVSYSFSYQVNNEVAEIGTLQTFKINYQDVVASLDRFSADSRTYPIEYWKYEDADMYETIVNISAPAGKKFVEIPVSENFAFKDLKYSLQFNLKSPTNLVVTRKFTNDRPQQIAPSDYTEFKSFFEKIVKVEQKFIAYK